MEWLQLRCIILWNIVQGKHTFDDFFEPKEFCLKRAHEAEEILKNFLKSPELSAFASKYEDYFNNSSKYTVYLWSVGDAVYCLNLVRRKIYCSKANIMIEHQPKEAIERLLESKQLCDPVMQVHFSLFPAEQLIVKM